MKRITNDKSLMMPCSTAARGKFFLDPTTAEAWTNGYITSIETKLLELGWVKGDFPVYSDEWHHLVWKPVELTDRSKSNLLFSLPRRNFDPFPWLSVENALSEARSVARRAEGTSTVI